MNRIYKSIFNAARRCVMCVSEATGSAQGRKGNRVVSESQSFVKPFRKTTLALLLGAMGSVVMANPLPRDVLFPIGGVNYDCSGTSCVPVDYGGESNWTYEFSGISNKKILDMVVTTNEYLYLSLADGGSGSLSIKEGTEVNIVGGDYQYNAFYSLATNSGSAEIINKGKLTIKGGADASAIENNAETEGSTAIISNLEEGTLVIQGGGSYGSGIHSNAKKLGSNALIINKSINPLIIQGGNEHEAHGLCYNSLSGNGEIINAGLGTLFIIGGDTSNAYGIKYNAAFSSVANGIISNVGTGTLTIQGGTVGDGIGYVSHGRMGVVRNSSSGVLNIQGRYKGNGVHYVAYGDAAEGKAAEGKIENLADGTLNIKGSSLDGSGIGVNASDGGIGVISNTGSGTLTIEGGSGESSSGIGVNSNLAGSKGTIVNEGEHTLIIKGGSGNLSDGISYNAYNGGEGFIKNTGLGMLIIQGSDSPESQGNYGINKNSSDFANETSSVGTISNENGGSLIIRGGNSYSSDGINYNAEDGALGIIQNIGNGTLTIQGSDYALSSGINILSYSDSFNEGSESRVINGEKGTLNILGNESLGTYGIFNLTYGKSSALIENAGVMNLNANSIGVFVREGSPNSVSVTNKSTGVVNAEAAAIFESTQTETTVDTPIPITIYTPNEGTKVTELDSYATSETTVITGWKLKDDWYNYSTWDDGGKLVITDVVAGSAEAQSIINAFQDRFGTGTTIEFTGLTTATYSDFGGGAGSEDPDEPSGEDPNEEIISDVFTITHVQELIDKGELKNGSVVTSEVLSGKVPGSFTVSALVIGEPSDGNDVISQDVGFKGIVDYSDVRVTDGYSLTLVGEQASMAMALRTTESQATFELTNRPVIVEENSTLKLGIAELSPTQGYFEDLDMTDGSASLSVENGIFQITNITGNGQINVQEKGQLTISNQASAGDVVNKGVLNANTLNTQIGVSASVTTYAEGDQNHFETFTNEKGGEANFADVSITEGANVKNKAEATINAGSVVLDGGAVITNFADGTLNFDSFEMNGTLRNNGTINVGGEMSLAEGTTTTLAGKVTAGTFSIGRAAQKAQAASVATMTDPQTVAEITGETYSDVLDLAGGDVFVRKDAILAGIDLMDNIVNSKVTVDTDGTFAFSFNENQLEDALKDLKLDTEGKALAVLSTDLSFGETGSLTIGTTDAQETVNLGSDALVLLATDSLHGNAVLNGEGKETLNIKDGAELAFTDNAIWGNHYLVRDFVSMDAAENLTVKDLEGNVLETHYNDKGIYVTIGSTNILDKDAAFGLSNNINAIMDGQQNTASSLADIRYLSMAMGANDGVKQTNDLEHLSAQAGVLSEAYRLTDNAHESIIRHAMSDKYSNVWVEALAGKGGVDGAGTGYGDASYDSDSYGMIFGLDGRIGKSINVGAAIHYQKGDLEADSSQTKNEFKNYGASIYAGTNFGNLNVTAGLTYAKGDHEFNQVNLGYVEGDTNTEVFMGGIRASYPIMVDRILITPYAGIEAVHVKEDGFTATIGGAEAFDFGSVSETFARVPMGVKFSGGNDRFAGFADISVIPQFGNRDAKQSVSGINTKATDAAKFDYADSVLGRVKMGAAYQVTPSTTLSVSYGASMGDVRDLSHEFSLNAKYRF